MPLLQARVRVSAGNSDPAIRPPAPFELTKAEATRVMAVQSDRQAVFARDGAKVQRLPLLLPAVAFSLLLLLDLGNFLLDQTSHRKNQNME